jgi:hypothetical protein
MIVALSSLGLPLLNGFVGEFLIIVGAYHQRPLYAAMAAVGVVLAAVYLLWMYQRVFLGEVTNEKNRNLPDCDAREKLILVVIVLVILAMGVYPRPFLRRMDRSVEAVLQRVEQKTLLFADKAPAGPRSVDKGSDPAGAGPDDYAPPRAGRAGRAPIPLTRDRPPVGSGDLVSYRRIGAGRTEPRTGWCGAEHAR